MAVSLECCEFEEGLPDGFCSTSGDGSDGLLPHPRHPRKTSPLTKPLTVKSL